MSKKRLKNHRKLHSVKLPCPICQSEKKSTLVVRCYRYFVYDHDIMWDGATLYLNKEQWTNKQEKTYFELHCTNGCDLNTLFEQESQLKEVLLPYVETLFEELVKVPPPPNKLPTTNQKEKKWVLRLVPRVPA